MNEDTFAGNWKQFQGKVQKQWGKLTNDQVEQIKGNRTALVGLIQKNYGIMKDEAEHQVKEWEKLFSA